MNQMKPCHLYEVKNHRHLIDVTPKHSCSWCNFSMFSFPIPPHSLLPWEAPAQEPRPGEEIQGFFLFSDHPRAPSPDTPPPLILPQGFFVLGGSRHSSLSAQLTALLISRCISCNEPKAFHYCDKLQSSKQDPK